MSSFSDIQAIVSQLKELITVLVKQVQDIKATQVDAIAAKKEIDRLNGVIDKLQANTIDSKQVDATIADIVAIKTLIQNL